MSKTIRIGGRYRHYKGNEYTVLAIARHSETLEEMVVYKALYGDGQVWVRPLSMFTESVSVNGVEMPRFAKMDDGSEKTDEDTKK